VIERRTLLIASAALAAMPRAAFAQTKLVLGGTLEQGSLVVGKTEPGATVQVDHVPVRVAADGSFAYGFDYNRIEKARFTAIFADGSGETREIVPAVRQYEVQKINGLPEQQAHPSAPDIVARIQREHALVAEARKTDSDLTFFAEPLDWPARGIISGVFGSQRILNGVPSAPHFGVDVAGGEGAPIHAPAGATVLLAEQFFLEGGYTLLDHGHGVFTGYMHQSVQLVKAGDHVERGQQIGNIGHTGRATGPHLHWQMNWFGVRLDPSLSTRTPAPEK
jgi:murein DD-endopeptidase MepM/ murein hydrolase activator NlpD